MGFRFCKKSDIIFINSITCKIYKYLINQASTKGKMPSRHNFPLVARYLLLIHLLLVARCKITCYSLWNSLVTHYKFTRCSLLVEKWLVTRCRIRLLLDAEVARCKKSLVTCYRSCSLKNLTRISLQNCSLLVLEVARCKKLLPTRYKNYSL